MTSSTTGEIAARSHGWSPELLTLLGAMLAIGVGLAGLMFSFQGQVRDDIRAVETRLREDMGTMETRLREEMNSVETRIISAPDRSNDRAPAEPVASRWTTAKIPPR